MSKKRRTKKQKIKAKHDFVYSWSPNSNEAKKSNSVKRQKKSSLKLKKSGTNGDKNANNKASFASNELLKKELRKSLSLAIVILSLELMLYFIW